MSLQPSSVEELPETVMKARKRCFLTELQTSCHYWAEKSTGHVHGISKYWAEKSTGHVHGISKYWAEKSTGHVHGISKYWAEKSTGHVHGISKYCYLFTRR